MNHEEAHRIADEIKKMIPGAFVDVIERVEVVFNQPGREYRGALRISSEEEWERLKPFLKGWIQ